MFLDFSLSTNLSSPTNQEAEQALVLDYLADDLLSDWETPSYYGRWETPNHFVVWSKSRPSTIPCLVVVPSGSSFIVYADELWDVCPFEVEEAYKTVKRVHKWTMERWRKL
jgi:hypothetical protein